MIAFFIAVGELKYASKQSERMKGSQASENMLFLASGKERKRDYRTLQLTRLKKLYPCTAGGKSIAELAPTKEVFGIQLVLQLMSLENPEYPVIKWALTEMMTVWNLRRWASGQAHEILLFASSFHIWSFPYFFHMERIFQLQFLIEINTSINTYWGFVYYLEQCDTRAESLNLGLDYLGQNHVGCLFKRSLI